MHKIYNILWITVVKKPFFKFLILAICVCPLTQFWEIISLFIFTKKNNLALFIFSILCLFSFLLILASFFFLTYFVFTLLYFKFNDSVLCYFYSATEPIQWIFNFRCCLCQFLNFQFFSGFFLAKISYFISYVYISFMLMWLITML